MSPLLPDVTDIEHGQTRQYFKTLYNGPNMNRIISFFNKLGPGLLLAATSIGASHLVMSPQAGSKFGFSAAPVVLGIILGPIVEDNFIKGKMIAETDVGIFTYFFTGNVNLIIIGLCLVSVFWSAYAEIRAGSKPAEVAGGKPAGVAT